MKLHDDNGSTWAGFVVNLVAIIAVGLLIIAPFHACSRGLTP